MRISKMYTVLNVPDIITINHWYYRPKILFYITNYACVVKKNHDYVVTSQDR